MDCLEIVVKKFRFSITEEKQTYHRNFMSSALQLPVPEQAYFSLRGYKSTHGRAKIHSHLGFKVARRISVRLASLFKIGRTDLLSDWAAQAAEQHGGHSLLQWGDCGGDSSSCKVFKHLK